MYERTVIKITIQRSKSVKWKDGSENAKKMTVTKRSREFVVPKNKVKEFKEAEKANIEAIKKEPVLHFDLVQIKKKDNTSQVY